MGLNPTLNTGLKLLTLGPFSAGFNNTKVKGKVTGDTMNVDVTMGENNFKMVLKRAAS